MLKVKSFVFNPFQVNTYLLYNEAKECVIIDAACYSEEEKNELEDFITQNKLQPKVFINTHTHIDHILGVNFILNRYNISLTLHKDGINFINNAVEWAANFGLQTDPIINNFEIISDECYIYKIFNEEEIELVHIPGHCVGSLGIISHSSKLLFTGDVLFKGSIGRTDLPSGDFETIKKSIKDKLYILSDDYVVYPGHGDLTTIGDEKRNNIFVRA
ncbi:MAG: MBL fold metallo-hydrolase [Bacteroidales bacterium]|nr:MBL fold metallo-hydrolase [Bacteroidales bacterium]